MSLKDIGVFLLVVISILQGSFSNTEESLEENISNKLLQFDNEYKMMWWLHQTADWNYSTNISKATAASFKEASKVFTSWMKEWKVWARKILLQTRRLPPNLRQLVGTIASGVVYLNEDESRIISDLKSKLINVYSSATVKLPMWNISAQGENEVSSLMKQIRNPQLLKEIWKAWRRELEGMKPFYMELIKLTNKAAQENGYSDVGEAWREELGLEDAVASLLNLWNEVKDFYKELHAYSRHKLQNFFGSHQFHSKKLIPAHLLGSLWGENWSSMNDILMPYPKKKEVNITSYLVSKKYNVTDIIHLSEQFYTRMGLDPMKTSFWKNSLFEKPSDERTVDCHSVSYDFALEEDFRVRMCGKVKEDSFIEAIHEMGHIQYYMSYHHLPMIFRNGANSAFHEAVGETMVYAALSPKCLRNLKMTKHKDTSTESTLNTLMKQALSKFVLLPWALTVEIWRYQLFSGGIKDEDMMTRWWDLRKLFQGIEPPDTESFEMFDPGSKYHIVMHLPYVRYFLSRFLEHQFLESLCIISGEPIHSCCFINSKKAGTQLKNMLSLGASVPWQDALESLTGKRVLSARPMINYYRPLYDWLRTYNTFHNITANW